MVDEWMNGMEAECIDPQCNQIAEGGNHIICGALNTILFLNDPQHIKHWFIHIIYFLEPCDIWLAGNVGKTIVKC